MIQIYDDRYRQEVIDLILHVQNVEYGVGISIEDQPDILDITKSYINDGGGFWIALNESGKVIGSIGLQKKGMKIAVLKKFFVYNEYKGKDHSVGVSLYNSLLSFAKEKGFSKIILDTPSVAIRSHGFYRKVGFKEITRKDLPLQYDYPDRNSLLFLLEIK